MKDRIIRYQSVRGYCGNNFLSNHSVGNVKKDFCYSWSCVRCRKKMMFPFFKKLVSVAEDNNLVRHLVITFPGDEMRNVLTDDQSFVYNSRKFNDFRKMYRRRFKENMKYIAFNRSQYSGYSHYHILVSKYIPKSWLEKAVKSLNLGYAKIKYVDVHRLGNYLSKYFYKEHEWYIPKNKRHFNTSRDIRLNDFQGVDGWEFIGIPFGVKDIYKYVWGYCMWCLGYNISSYFFMNSCYVVTDFVDNLETFKYYNVIHNNTWRYN